MSTPECPPFKPETLIRNGVPEPAALYDTARRAVVFTPPEQPIQRVPISSLSRFRKYLAFSMPGPNCAAPVKPVSSSMVKTNSSGPCEMSVLSITASADATPIPLSAPSVVPSALSHSPSRQTLIVPLQKSNRGVFASRASGLANHHVANRVLLRLQAMLCRQAKNVLPSCGLIA